MLDYFPSPVNLVLHHLQVKIVQPSQTSFKDDRETKGFHLLRLLLLIDIPTAIDDHIAAGAVLCRGGSLTVLLGQSQGQQSQELVHSHVDHRGEILGEEHGQHHQDAVSQDLGETRKNERTPPNSIKAGVDQNISAVRCKV